MSEMKETNKALLPAQNIGVLVHLKHKNDCQSRHLVQKETVLTDGLRGWKL